jgi:hypothetical protein
VDTGFQINATLFCAYSARARGNWKGETNSPAGTRGRRAVHSSGKVSRHRPRAYDAHRSRAGFQCVPGVHANRL